MPATQPCSLCKQPATFRCSSCRQVFYCTEQHHTEDWPRHKPKCRAFMVSTSECGPCLKATRNIKKGEVLFTETPLLIGPAHFSPTPICVGCSCGLPMGVNTLPKCPQCQWAVCSPNCPKLSDPAGHVVECAMLKLVEDKRWSLLLPYRCMFLQKSNARLWNWLLDHTMKAVAKQADPSKYDRVASMLEKTAKTIFEKNPSLLPIDYSAVMFKQIYAVLDVYGLYSWTSPLNSDLTGLYKVAGFLRMSCVANTRTDFYVSPRAVSANEFGRVVITAIKDIQRGELLSSSYAASLASTYIRQKEFARRNMVCQCPRCLDPRELGLDFGTMKCPSCPGLILPVDTSHILTCDWACDKLCGVTRTAAEVLERCDFFHKLYGDNLKPDSVASTDPQAMEGLFAHFLTELHPNHIICFFLRRIVSKSYDICDILTRLSYETKATRQSVLSCEMLNVIHSLGVHTYRSEMVVVYTVKEFAEIHFDIIHRSFPSQFWTIDRTISMISYSVMLLKDALKLLQDMIQLDILVDFDLVSSMQTTYSNIVVWAAYNRLDLPDNANPAMLSGLLSR